PGLEKNRIHDAFRSPRPHLDAVSARLPLDLAAPRIRIAHIREPPDNISSREELAVVVAASHAADEHLDPPPDFNWVFHDAPFPGRAARMIPPRRPSPEPGGSPPRCRRSFGRATR